MKFIKILVTVFSANIYAAQPLVTITPLFKAPATLASNSFSAAMYLVTNNTKTLTSFVMQANPGVEQVTNIPGACGNPITLNYGESCQLDLKIVGKVSGGPVICNNAPKPLSCSQPSVADSMTVSLTQPITQNTWISVLIAQDQPPDDIATYMNQIISLAPAMEQLHLRVTPGDTNYALYSNLIRLLHTAYGADLQIGYHPDNSSSSYSGWGCDTPPPSPPNPAPVAPNVYSSCVLNATLQNMNAMNAAIDPNNTGMGFTIFSLEQDDVEISPSTNENFQDIKACLNPAVAAQGSSCPVATLASPVVTFGDVTQSYGEGYYGPTMLDYTYPQFYNLGKRISTYQDLFTNGFFPTYTTSCETYSQNLYVVDVDSNSAYAPEIPCLGAGQTYPNAYSYQDPSTHTINPSIASAYMSYLMTQEPPIAVTIPLSGSIAYITFSGEDFILGSPGWNLSALGEFFSSLTKDFVTLKGIYPELFPPQGTDPTTLKYAIWNFSSVLGNE